MHKQEGTPYRATKCTVYITEGERNIPRIRREQIESLGKHKCLLLFYFQTQFVMQSFFWFQSSYLLRP